MGSEIVNGIDIDVLTPGYVAAQAVLLAAALVRYVLPLVRRVWQIRSAQDRAGKLLGAPKPPDERRAEAAHTLFEATKWARPHFRAFVASWRDARLEGEERAAVCVSIRSFLTPDVVLHQAANQRTSEALPGIFLALGIFGTFLGLVLGLQDIQIGGRLQEMEEGVRNLVQGLSLAFLTSLVGISSSVLFSFLHKTTVRRLEQAVQRLDASLAEIFPCASEEFYGRKFLELQTDIKGQMQTLATDIATQVAASMEPAMGQAVSSHLAPVLEKMRGMMERYFDQAEEKHAAAVEGMLKEYVSLLQGTFTSQINDITRMIEETTRAQSAIREEMTRFGETLQRQFNVQTELIEKTSDAGRILNESLDSLSAISSELKASAGDVSTAAHLLSDASEKARQGQRELSDLLAQQIEAMQTTREGLEGSWKTISSGMSSVVEHTGELIDRMAEALGEHLTGALNSFDDKLAEIVERFSGTLFETKETIEELPSLLGDLSGSFDSIATNTQTLKEVLADLRATTENLVAPNVEDAARAAAELSRATETTRNTAAAFDQWLNRLDERVRDHLAGYNQVLESAGHSLLEALAGRETREDGELLEAMGRLDEHLIGLRSASQEVTGRLEAVSATLEAGTGEVRAFLRNRGNGNGEAIEGLGSRIDQVSVRTDDLRGDVRRLEEKADRILTMVRQASLENRAAGQGETIEPPGTPPLEQPASPSPPDRDRSGVESLGRPGDWEGPEAPQLDSSAGKTNVPASDHTGDKAERGGWLKGFWKR
jgi:methyl-accepting chemotaxis protein